MANITPRDFSPPVERIAQCLLESARACPELIRRTWDSVSVPAELELRLPKPELAPFPKMALLSDPALDIRQYLEDLVSIAVSSAQQAEDVSLRASEVSRKARRGMITLACCGALGVAVGLAGFATAYAVNGHLAQVREEVSALKDMQRQAHDQPGEIATPASAQRFESQTTRRAEAAPSQAAPAPVSAPIQLVWKSPVSASQPWPDSRPPILRRAAPPARTHEVVVPRFIANLQQNIRALFR